MKEGEVSFAKPKLLDVDVSSENEATHRSSWGCDVPQVHRGFRNGSLGIGSDVNIATFETDSKPVYLFALRLKDEVTGSAQPTNRVPSKSNKSLSRGEAVADPRATELRFGYVSVARP